MSAGRTYNYDSTCHDDAAQAIQQADSDIRNELDACDTFAMQHMSEEDWSGPVSRQTYDDAKTRWNSDFTAMQNVLTKASPVLQNVKDNYDQTDHRIKRRFSSH
jgi:WXG100 family type VII secretion target